MKLAVGTTSKNKIRLLNEVLQELAIEAEVIPCDAKSGVSAQPLSSNETQRGATTRAMGAHAFVPDVDYGLGIEVGYDRNERGVYSFLCWATILDRDGRMVSCCSDLIVLSEVCQAALDQAMYLIDYVKETNPEEAVMLARHRAEAIQSSLELVLHQIL